MVLSCAVKNCPSQYKKDCGIRFHLFPEKNCSLKQKWIEAINIVGFHPKRSRCVCNEHFHYSDYSWSPIDNKFRLKRGAVPSVFNVTSQAPNSVYFAKTGSNR